MYNVGEQVVNRDSYKQGVISEINESKIHIKYEDGSSEWLEEGKVLKFLLDDGPSGTMLTE